MDARILELLNDMEPITLEQMSSIRLMNRTDTKFVTNKTQLVRLLQHAQGKYYAQVNEGKRVATYRTIYWDTEGHRFYLEHHNGRAPRQKVRIRTYMDSGITFLEVKTKNNHARTKKKRIEIPAPDRWNEVGGNEFVDGLVHAEMQEMRPTVQNLFNRITLVNHAKTERLTIDFNVQFKNFETHQDCGTGELVIIELKRDGNQYSPVLDILRKLRVKPSGFSKYCIGSLMTNDALKRNMFREKLVTIHKLVNNTY
ncbi:MAG: polyphosphate polymerase domain-containing protein [Paraprevotella sp.]|nr:polyphosphate polymerase domain-containing protein [Paraprevotella sp.]